jgi:hypothetical protein
MLRAMGQCFGYRKGANDDGFVRMDDSVSETLSHELKSNIMSLQRDTSDTSVWNKVAYTPEDIHNIEDDYTIGCLQEAYFAIQNSCSICHLHVRFAQKYTEYLVGCSLDSRFDVDKAMIIFGHKAALYLDVCRANGFCGE